MNSTPLRLSHREPSPSHYACRRFRTTRRFAEHRSRAGKGTRLHQIL